MKKPLAILATVATLGATTMSAPAEAGGWGHHGGWGPALGFGLAAGALTAGAIAASRPYYGPDYYGASLLQTRTVRLLRRTLLCSPPSLAVLLITTKARSLAPGSESANYFNISKT